MNDPTQTTTAAATTTTQQTQRVFNIPQDVKDKYPDLVELIMGSASMNDDERQYWFSILPIMTQDQVNRLREILTTEKQRLSEIDAKYQKQLDQINEKHLIEWQTTQRKEKQASLQKAEQKNRSSEEQEADNLLQQLDHV